MIRIRIACIFTLAGLLLPLPLQAEQLRHRADFDINLAGLPFAKASFESLRDDNLYEIEVNFRAAGVGHVVNDMTAELASSGVIEKSGLQAQRYYLQYRKGSRHRRFEAEFKNGDVIATRIEPGENDPCRPLIPIYDGEARLDINLARKGEQEFKTEGFNGKVVVCSMRYTPLAGYRKGSREAEFLKRLNRMEIWFAKSDRMNVYAPVYFSVPTRFGTLTMKATRFDG